jgi:hypothetical protein
METLYLRGSNDLAKGILMTKKKSASSPKKSAAAKPAEDFAGVFDALKEVLKPYE